MGRTPFFGFPLLVLAVAGALAWLEIAVFQHNPLNAGRLAIFIGPVLFVLITTLLLFERTRSGRVLVVPVTSRRRMFIGAHADGFVWSYNAFGSVHEFRKIRSRACRLAK